MISTETYQPTRLEIIFSLANVLLVLFKRLFFIIYLNRALVCTDVYNIDNTVKLVVFITEHLDLIFPCA